MSFTRPDETVCLENLHIAISGLVCHISFLPPFFAPKTDLSLCPSLLIRLVQARVPFPQRLAKYLVCSSQHPPPIYFVAQNYLHANLYSWLICKCVSPQIFPFTYPFAATSSERWDCEITFKLLLLKERGGFFSLTASYYEPVIDNSYLADFYKGTLALHTIPSRVTSYISVLFFLKILKSSASLFKSIFSTTVFARSAVLPIQPLCVQRVEI